jgi:hypothetical protein
MKTALTTLKGTAVKAASPQVAETDGNRTRRRRDAPPTGFEDRGGHQAPGRLRGRIYPRLTAPAIWPRAARPAGRTVGQEPALDWTA